MQKPESMKIDELNVFTQAKKMIAMVLLFLFDLWLIFCQGSAFGQMMLAAFLLSGVRERCLSWSEKRMTQFVSTMC